MSSWKAATLLLVLHALFGALAGMFLGDEGADLVLSAVQVVVVTGVLFAWALLDARSHGRELRTTQGVCIVLFSYAAIPFYLGFYREPQHWLRWIGKGVVIFLGCIGLFALSAVLTSGNLA